MRWHRACSIVVFLLLGAIVNVAVAWGAVFNHAWIPAGQVDIIEETPVGVPWLGRRGYHAALFRHYNSESTNNLVRNRILAERTNLVIAAGWPALCVVGQETWHDLSRSRRIDCFEWNMKPARPGRSLLLPCRPMWTGFVINTLIYAAVTWIIVRGCGFVRACLWSWRGRCARCGYLRGESSTCPECGAQHAIKSPPHSAPPQP